jgi:hypothetical protein
MPAARPQAFTAMTDGGAAVAGHGCGGCCACRPPRRGAFLQPVGIPLAGAMTAKTCDWVRRRLR